MLDAITNFGKNILMIIKIIKYFRIIFQDYNSFRLNN
jgi:hypothetical protein